MNLRQVRSYAASNIKEYTWTSGNLDPLQKAAQIGAEEVGIKHRKDEGLVDSASEPRNEVVSHLENY